jgi:asparagine synthase (glutamine-hydrolysing)
MCGIVGIAGSNSLKALEPVVKKMAACIMHRGPDDEGFLLLDNCLLGHRRLSIVDLVSGKQPITSPFGTSIIFNGEFYGYKSVKQETEYPYVTTSDTEVILALYHKYGADKFIEHVKGMFSFAIWDEPKKELFAARDRFGEKPFYYAYTKNGELIFASELKAITATGLIDTTLNNEAVVHFLKHLYVHPRHTIYKNVFVLPPAHYLIYKEGKTTVLPYWKLPKEQLKITYEDAVKEFSRLLKKSVEQQMVADVTVGCFLSGGIDSSTVAALSASVTNKKLTTISFSFGNDKEDLYFSRQIAKKYNTENIELHQSDYDIAAWFEKMAAVYDEPFADSSNIPTYLISKMAAEKLKVVLTGDGADELLGGYTSWYQPIYNLQNPSGIKGRLKNITKKILHPHYRNERIENLHLNQNTYFSDSDVTKLCRFTAGKTFDKFMHQPYNTVDAAMRMDLQDYMPGDILVKTDRAAMANSLELRAPFLDVAFAEFCIALPEEYKITNNTTKRILKESCGSLLTPDILSRKKSGFGAPVTAWLNQPKMLALKNDVLLNPNSKIYTLLDYNACKPFINASTYQTWILLTFALWLNQNN